MYRLALGISVISLLGYGISVLAVTRSLGLLGTTLIRNEYHMHLAIFGITLMTSVLQSSIYEVIAAAVIIAITGLRFPDQKAIIAIQAAAFLVMNSIVHTDSEAHGMFIIMTAGFAFKIQAKVALKSQSEQDVAEAKSKIDGLKQQLDSLVKQRANFEEIHKPLSAQAADDVTQKLRSIRHLFPGTLPHLNINRNASNDQSTSLLGKSNDYISLDSESEFDISSNRSRIDRQLFSQEDVDDILYSVANREYLIWNTESNKGQTLTNILKITDQSKLTFAQSFQQLYMKKLSDHALPKAHKLDKKVASFNPQTFAKDKNMELWLSAIGDWNFDTLEFSNRCGKEPMLQMGMHIYNDLGLVQTFNIDENVLGEFLRTAEDKYIRENYYHNNIHAADVTNSSMFLLSNGLYKRGSMADIEVLALITASLCHDIAHPGLNNAFLVASKHPLAFKYNDSSVLENMHASTTFVILKNARCNILQTLTKEDFIKFRKICIDLILATDLQQHFGKVKTFKEIMESEEGLNMEEDEQRKKALEICLKCSDIGHGAKELELHKQWSGHITREFFMQGDKEKDFGLPVSPLNDRETVVLAPSQKGFLNFLVMPLFDAFEMFIKQAKGVTEDDPALLPVKLIKRNIKYWESEIEEPHYVLPTGPSVAILQRY